MKTAITTGYSFNPASSQINFSSIANFDIRKLYAVIDVTVNNTMIYAVGLPGFGYSAISGTLLTLQASMVGLSAGDSLVVLYEQSGSLGKDYSVNTPSMPNVGANFGSSGIYANYVLVQTVAVNLNRLNIDVENTTGGQIVIIRDDGTASNGSQPNNATMFALGGGVAVGAEGGSWSSTTFKGRLQIYAPSQLFVAVMED